MVALGGPGTIAGPFLGSIVIIFMKNMASAYTDRYMFLLGVIYIVTVFYTPRGLIAYGPVALNGARKIRKRISNIFFPSSERS